MIRDAEYPEYIGITDVRTKSHEQMRVEIFAEGQASIMADEPQGFDIGDPPALRGQSRGWTPVHYQLAGLAACTSITLSVVALDQGFKYQSLETAIRSLIDIRGFFFDLDKQPKFEQINFDLIMDTDEPIERIQALANESHRRCPQLIIFFKAQIPMLISWYVRGQETPRYVQRFFIEDDLHTPEISLIKNANNA